MATKKIFYVRWEDADGEQGYYVRMTYAEANKILRFLNAAVDAGKIKNSSVGAIEGEWVLTPNQLTKEFKERYSNA